MGVVECALWGLFGGFAVEGLDFAGAIRRTGGWPWKQPEEPGPVPFLVSVVIRLAVGGGLAVAAGSAGQISGPFGALAIGIAAPLVVAQLAGQVPLTPGSADEPQDEQSQPGSPAALPHAGDDSSTVSTTTGGSDAE
ncbi:hypothetical protein LX15_003574 [Streptoalloteichus tenebrarius]|uniref:Uncharacterized protein n=1 Tax=Streptoalloteichus tenebrarius (strain ATCC 17920 / DSM 40477 / JCM 4838 / CBS 697.72 / NBRC 16177 / NCIMB 11028 / NRRL B-12390 / A12253. 1 / ISP 5477) TaxID=1933 RepID=A0ABT1HWU0_STRSD|nr:hypothetical protein [Streptoalloteichus tenebrarius]MCP2259865.1 hypothetical protein [Streptoalloteichus tenebrarius]BFE99185.1 hypothetical protein GCM10020241_08610 [Streptoalloteichus tenebrarius]